MSYTTIPGGNVATPVDSVASSPTAPSRRNQVRRAALYSAAGVFAALVLVSVHDRYAAPRLATPVDMRRYPSTFPYAYPPSQPLGAEPGAPSLRKAPRVAMMHAASQRFSPVHALTPSAGFAAADAHAMRMHPRASLMRDAAARFAPTPRFGAPRPFAHPALYNRVETAPPTMHAAMVARGGMYDPRMMRGFGAVPPHMYFGQHAAPARGYAPLAPQTPMHPEMMRSPVGAPHFVHRI